MYCDGEALLLATEIMGVVNLHKRDTRLRYAKTGNSSWWGRKHPRTEGSLVRLDAVIGEVKLKAKLNPCSARCNLVSAVSGLVMPKSVGHLFLTVVFLPSQIRHCSRIMLRRHLQHPHRCAVLDDKNTQQAFL